MIYRKMLKLQILLIMLSIALLSVLQIWGINLKIRSFGLSIPTMHYEISCMAMAILMGLCGTVQPVIAATNYARRNGMVSHSKRAIIYATETAIFITIIPNAVVSNGIDLTAMPFLFLLTAAGILATWGLIQSPTTQQH